MNTRIPNAWYTSRGLPEPWAAVLAEPPGGHTKKRRETSTT